MFRHYHRHPRFRGHASLQSYTPKQVASLYSYPTGATGAGQKVGIISLGGDFLQSDLSAFRKLIGVVAASITVHLVAGATRASDPGGADVENALDMCCVSGAAPGAELHAFLAPNTDAGFAAAVQAAVDFGVDAITISWGAPENEWSTSAKAAMNQAFANARAKGIPVFAAAGDNGSGDGESGNHVDFPASSPLVVGCGGTTITSSSPLAEKVWNDGTQGGATGGGVSTDFALPVYQDKTVVPGGGVRRGVPDIALNADPESGYVIVSGGQQEVVGGTSAAAPMAAGLCLCLQEKLGKRLGDFNGAVYPLAGSATRDITTGNNGTYAAKSGYDCCTGTGVPNGQKLLAALQGASAPPAPPPPPTPTPAPTPSSVTRTVTFTTTDPNATLSVDGKKVA